MSCTDHAHVGLLQYTVAAHVKIRSSSDSASSGPGQSNVARHVLGDVQPNLCQIHLEAHVWTSGSAGRGAFLKEGLIMYPQLPDHPFMQIWCIGK